MKRIDAIFAVERTINGSTASQRQAVRDQTIRPLVEDLVAWLNEQRRTLSPKSETAKLNDVDPRAWLADVLARLPDHPARHIADLLPWRWQKSVASPAKAA